MACDAKEREINDFLAGTAQEREKLVARLDELDRARDQAEDDLRRLNGARNALRNPDEQKMARDDLACVGAGAIPVPRAAPQYFPGR